MNQDDQKRLYELTSFLQSTYLFGEMISSIIQHWIAKKIRILRLNPDEELLSGDNKEIVLIFNGEADIMAEDTILETIKTGDFFGEETFLLDSSNIFSFHAKTPVELALIPCDALKNIPIVEWKLYEVFEKRLQLFGTLLNK